MTDDALAPNAAMGESVNSDIRAIQPRSEIYRTKAGTIATVDRTAFRLLHLFSQVAFGCALSA